MMLNICDIHVTIQPINEEIISRAKRLYVDQPHKVSLWDWQFSHRFGRTPVAVTAWHGEELIGFNALMPVTLKVAEEDGPAWWSCDFIVNESYRGHGLGSRLKDEIITSIKDPVMSLGISDSALPILVKKGWSIGPDLSVYEKFVKPKGIKHRAVALIGSFVFKLIGLKLGRQAASNLRCEESDVLPPRASIENIGYHVRDKTNISVVRDYEYLKWRYEQFPFGGYRFLLMSDSKSHPKALIVYRVSQEKKIEIVDTLGDVTGSLLVYSATLFLLNQAGAWATSIAWRVSTPESLASLWLCGFVKKRYGTRFVYKLNGDGAENASWLLSAGDSDGDFLAAASEYYSKANPQEHTELYTSGRSSTEDLENEYTIRQVSEKEFRASEFQWNRLLENSSANSMFMSWDWQYDWWKTWGEKLDVQLYCHFVYRSDELVGILPLFKRVEGFGLLTQYHFIGNAWRIAPTIRSEYISPILLRDQEKELYEFIDRWMRSARKLSYFVIQDYVGKYARTKNAALVRQVDYGYAIPTQGDLETYKNGLGKQTRLRAFNRLDYLQAAYPGASWQEYFPGNDSLDAFFDDLNAFHMVRWGKPCFSENAVEFHKRVILKSKQIVPLLHCLRIHGKTVSLSYNLIVDGVLYNLQSGFIEDFDKKLSLGTLHFGKIISIAFESAEIHSLDLLAGKGKHTDYKNHFKGNTVEFRTLQIFPSKIFFWIYALGRQAKFLVAEVKRMAS